MDAVLKKKKKKKEESTELLETELYLKYTRELGY